MPIAADRPEFAPPPQPGLLGGLAFAILAHSMLLLALALGVQWTRESKVLTAEAELWSQLPQQAALKVEPPPPPPAPEPKPKPVVQPKPEPVKREVDIAQEREREKQKKKLEAQRLQEEEKKKKEAAAKEKEKERKELEAKKAKQKEEEARKLAKQYESDLKRIQGMASGVPGATAARSSGPSDSWAGRIRARVRPNIVFGDEVSGNPKAEVEVHMAPDGTITNKRVVKSSGIRSWDDAVLRALDKTEVLPRDIDGQVHSPVILEFRPKD